MNTDVYREIKAWKKPLHISRSLFAKKYLKLLSNVQIIGVSGSVGKTLTQNSIALVLAQKFKTKVGEENLDPTFRIPKTIIATKPWYQKLILEYGVERPGDMDYYLSLVKPKIAVVTTILPTHLKYFSNIEGIFTEKSKLVNALPKNGIAILNADDRIVAKMAERTLARVWWYGKKAKDSIKISHFSQNFKGAKFRIHYKGQKATVNWKIIGKHHLLSAYAAGTVGIVCGLTVKQIAKGLSLVKPPLHRLNSIVTKNYSIIDDTYNSSPKAADEALNTLIDLGKHKRKIAIFGEMKDLGNLSNLAHVQLGQKIAKSPVNYLITVAKTAGAIGKSAKKCRFGGQILTAKNTKEATMLAKKIANNNSVILVKGSRHAHLERIVNGLLNRSTIVNCYHCGQLK